MSYYSPSIEKLIEAFERLPSIGNKTAARLAFYMLNSSQEETDEFVIQPSLVLTDKEYESSILIKYLEKMSDINVRASNIDGVIAFLYAVISLLEEKDRFLEICLVIDNEESLEYYLTKENLILYQLSITKNIIHHII